MKWNDLLLGRKLLTVFAIVTALMLAIAVIGVTSINTIIKGADNMSFANSNKNEISQRYIDHLEWSKKLNEFITNPEVHDLNIETDDHKCAFGKWYYSDERKKIQKEFPELDSFLTEIEAPHAKLHESAIKIQEKYVKADMGMSIFLGKAKSDHLLWMGEIENHLFVNRLRTELEIEKDHTKCNFGKWIYSDEVQQFKHENKEFSDILENVIDPHKALHQSALEIEKYLVQGNLTQAQKHFMDFTQPTTYSILELVDNMIAWNSSNVDRMHDVYQIYEHETEKHLTDVGKIFNDIEDTYSASIEENEFLIKKKQGRAILLVILISIIATFLSILFALFITRNITGRINKSLVIAEKISVGDLTAKLDDSFLKQKDEIGVLSKALGNMLIKLREVVASVVAGSGNIASASQQISTTSQLLSQGASEQASSVEEVSATMEQMTSNIEQNNENAVQTEKMSIAAQAGINEVNERAQKAVEANRNISDKIDIINDIAFQTNILALNAAVEAARAGEHGKGFAVVAAEVRKLAERSKLAAEEIVTLSQNGLKLTQESGETLADMLPEVQKTTSLVQEISAASNEQTNGATQVNSAMQQLNSVTQQNAAASEELATSAEEMNSQAEELKQVVDFFKVDNEQLKDSGEEVLRPKQTHKVSPDLKQNEHKNGLTILQQDKVEESDNEFERF